MAGARRYLNLDKDRELVINKRLQMTTQMLTCIQASVLDECTLKVGEIYEIEEGPLYRRILISRVIIASISTVSHTPRTLSYLDDYMTSVDNNFTTLKKFVGLSRTRTARGESFSDVMVNLFKAIQLRQIRYLIYKSNNRMTTRRVKI